MTNLSVGGLITEARLDELFGLTPSVEKIKLHVSPEFYQSFWDEDKQRDVAHPLRSLVKLKIQGKPTGMTPRKGWLASVCRAANPALKILVNGEDIDDSENECLSD